MTLKTIYAAETWDAIYKVAEQVNFTSYDYNSIKEALINYIKIYYPENFNDFIESSELIEFIEIIAYAAELLAYKADVSAHENSINDADRKSSILKLAKFLTYTPTRNIPARGLVKISSVSTSETVYDSQGINLANRRIIWNDPNNSMWKEQFFVVMNRVLRTQFGQPIKAYNVGDAAFQLYELDNKSTSFKNSVFPYSVTANNETISMELVCADIDENGAYEKYVDGSNTMRVLYCDDGLGNGSDLTGFMFYTKQGQLTKSRFTFSEPLPNRFITLGKQNINDTDVWVNKVDSNGNTIEEWEKVETIFGQNIIFNNKTNFKKFEVESLENDDIRISFGDGDFSEIPLGTFDIWTRQSINKNIVIQKNKIIDQSTNFDYESNLGTSETCSMTFSLVQSLQNSSESEDIEHIRRSAPLTFFSQNRLVSGPDYNTLPLRNQSILKLRSVNRTFAGESKYVQFNDASGNYQNVKLFGDDLRLYYDIQVNSQNSNQSARVLIDNVLEPLLASTAIQNTITYVRSKTPSVSSIRTLPRTVFEENIQTIQEKTKIQAALDSHYYGEPLEYVTISGNQFAMVSNDTDYLIYDATIPRTIDGVTPYGSGTPSGLQAVSNQQKFGLRYEITRSIIGNGPIDSLSITGLPTQTFTIECVDGENFVIVGSVTGLFENLATIGETYNSDGLTFTINQGSTPFVTGDAFVVNWNETTTAITTSPFNLHGEWKIINGVNLDTSGIFDLDSAGSALASSDSSWFIWIERNDDSFGNVIDWTITYRDVKIIATSSTTKFWYNTNDVIIDNTTKKRVRDKLQILKSNLNKDKTQSIGQNIVYDIVGPIIYNDGSTDFNSIEVYPTNNFDSPFDITNRVNSSSFTEFVDVAEDYVYYRVSGTKLEPITATSAIESLFAPGEFVSSNELYVRKIGRESLDFLWQHYSPNTNLIDPSPSNINDIFVLTKGYYDDMMSYVNGDISYEPAKPTPYDLRNTYSSLYGVRMMSDTIVMHSGKIKLLFGDLAESRLRSKFRIIKSPSAKLTDEQIKIKVVNLINEYFAIDNWDFGQTFYATELIAVLHTQLINEIASVVIVPTYANNSFGSLFIIESGEDEILQSAAQVKDIEIVNSFTPNILRQR